MQVQPNNNMNYQQNYNMNNNQFANVNSNNNPTNGNNMYGNGEGIDVNVYMMALQSGNAINFLQNVKNKAPYVQNELNLLTAPIEEQQKFIAEVCKKANMTQEQFFQCCNQILKGCY